MLVSRSLRHIRFYQEQQVNPNLDDDNHTQLACKTANPISTCATCQACHRPPPLTKLHYMYKR